MLPRRHVDPVNVHKIVSYIAQRSMRLTHKGVEPADVEATHRDAEEPLQVRYRVARGIRACLRKVPCGAGSATSAPHTPTAH